MKNFFFPVLILISIVIINIIPGACMNGPYTPAPGTTSRPVPIPVESIYVKGQPFINSLKCVVSLQDSAEEDKNLANQIIITSEEALKNSKDDSIFVNKNDFLYFSEKYSNCNFSV